MNHKNTKHIAFIGFMAAVICITAPFSFPLPISPVPISFGTLAIYFATSILGMRNGTLSVIIYILLGLAGLPVFSHFTGGVGILLGPTGGYLIGYVLLALIYGFFVDNYSNNLLLCVLGIFLGTFACYLFGTIWLSRHASLSFLHSLSVAVIPFLPGDLAKMVISLIGSHHIRKRLKKAGFL